SGPIHVPRARRQGAAPRLAGTIRRSGGDTRRRSAVPLHANCRAAWATGALFFARLEQRSARTIASRFGGKSPLVPLSRSGRTTRHATVNHGQRETGM